MAAPRRDWRRSRASLLLALMVCAGGRAGGATQSPPPAGGHQDVRIDAVVTDASGRPVLDLHPADFELRDNGVARPLEAVELREPPQAVGSLAAIETDADEAAAARQPGARLFAFFLDDFHVTPGAGADRIRAALHQLVDRDLRPGDLALVMRPLDTVTAIRFTRDRARLHAAIDGFAPRKGDYAPRTRFEALYIGRAPEAVSAARRQIVSAALRELTMRVGELEADRGVIVFVSEGFARDGNPAERQLRIPDLLGLVRASSRYHLATYTFDPSPSDPSIPAGSTAAADRQRSTEMLQWLAAQTGGRAVAGDRVTDGLARLARDLGGYYALTYQPPQADGRFHALDIRTRRRGLVVHSRPGYWAPMPEELRAGRAAAAPRPRRALRRSPAIEVFVGLRFEADGQARMVVTWEPRRRGVAAPEVVALAARTSAGTALFEGRLGRVGSGAAVPPDNARFAVPEGRIEIDLTIYDGEGKRIDTDLRDVDVPDLRSRKPGPVLLAPAVVRARTFRDFQAAATDPDAAPASVRTFARGDRLLIRVPAFDSSGAAVSVTARVLNAWGQPMRQIDELETPPAAMPQFALPLAWLAPGAYQIELTAANANGTVTERVAFKVAG